MASCKSCGQEFERDEGEPWKVLCGRCWLESKDDEAKYLALESRVADAEVLITQLMMEIRNLKEKMSADHNR
ncbi:MAG: hypothetical protein ACLFUU_13965 [Desulfobacteraceae bacterium]